jgi:hypothetical protein
MRKTLLINLLALVWTSSFASMNFAVPSDAQTSTTSFFQALAEKNTTSLNQLLTFDFGLVSFDGQIIDGKMLSEAVESGYITIENNNISSLRVRSYGDASVVTGIWNTKGTIQSVDFNTEVVFSAFCVKQGGAWKLASIQFTPVR